MRRAREAQYAAYQASRAVLDRAAQRRDAEWRAAADENRRRTLFVLAVPVAPALALIALGAVVPVLFAAGGVVALAWFVLAATAWRQAGSPPLGHLPDPAATVRAGALSPATAARLEDVTEGLCAALGLPVPGLRIVVDAAPNAATFGRRSDGAVIVLTSGLVHDLDRIELEAVLAHELAHVKRGDIVSAAVGCSIIGRLADAVTGGRAVRWLVGPERELRADLAAVGVTRYPPALIDTLERGRRAHPATPTIPESGSVRQSRQIWLMGADSAGLAARLDVLYEL